MHCDGIIFDVDGTLWDSTETVATAYNAAFAETGCADVRVTADSIRHEFGKPMDEIGRDLLPHLPAEDQTRIMTRCMEREDEYLRRYPPVPYPGLEETLDILRKNHPLFIVSNCQQGYIELFLETTGLSDRFADHLCWGDTGLLKADNIRLMAERHKLASPVYVGDIEADCTAARAAGTAFIWASYGFGTAAHPDAVIRSVRELPSLLNENTDPERSGAAGSC